jgi:hypothetical protein
VIGSRMDSSLSIATISDAIYSMPSKTFVLGAGFSADAGFPLVRTLSNDLVSWIEAEQHPSAQPHLTPNIHGYQQHTFST